MTDVPQSQTPALLTADEPVRRFQHSIPDPVFGAAEESLRRIEIIAWQALEDGPSQASSMSAKSGVEGGAASNAAQRLRRAIRDQNGPAGCSRVLMIGDSSAVRSASHPLMLQAAQVYADAGIDVEVVDCAFTDEIADQWTLAHAVHIVVSFDDALSRSRITQMIDRFDPDLLTGRAYGLVVHGIEPGVERLRRTLSDRLDAIGLIDAGAQSRLDRFIGYYQPYATGDDGLGQDQPELAESRNVARAVANAVVEIREGRLLHADLLVARSGAN